MKRITFLAILLIALLCSCNQEPEELEKYPLVDLIFAPSSARLGQCWFDTEEGDCFLICGKWDRPSTDDNNFRLDRDDQFLCWLDMESQTNLALAKINQWMDDCVLCDYPQDVCYVDDGMYYMPFYFVGDKVDHKFKLRFQKLSDSTMFTTRTLHIKTELNSIVRDTLGVFPNSGSAGEDVYDVIEWHRDVISISEE